MAVVGVKVLMAGVNTGVVVHRANKDEKERRDQGKQQPTLGTIN
jgi:hypothetical protein